MAAVQGNMAALKALLGTHPRMTFSDSTGRRAIHYAAKNGHLGCVELLLKAGAISNCADAEGFTPLHLACLNGHTEIVGYSVQEFVKMFAVCFLNESLEDYGYLSVNSHVLGSWCPYSFK